MNKFTYKKGGGSTFADKLKQQKRSTKITVISIMGAVLFVLLLLSPAFSIKSIDVTGIEHLQAENVIKASGICVGKNIFAFSSSKAEKALKTIAYVDDAKVLRRLPQRVEIRIDESRETAYLYFIGNYVGIDKKGKILEIKSKEDELKKPIILGTSVTEFGIGNNIKIDDEVKQEAIFEILKQIEENNMQEMIKTIDVADLDDIKFFATSECTINMGTMEDIIYKISFLKEILEEPGDKRGAVIDMRNPQKVTYRGS